MIGFQHYSTRSRSKCSEAKGDDSQEGNGKMLTDGKEDSALAAFQGSTVSYISSLDFERMDTGWNDI